MHENYDVCKQILAVWCDPFQMNSKPNQTESNQKIDGKTIHTNKQQLLFVNILRFKIKIFTRNGIRWSTNPFCIGILCD